MGFDQSLRMRCSIGGHSGTHLEMNRYGHGAFPGQGGDCFGVSVGPLADFFKLWFV